MYRKVPHVHPATGIETSVSNGIYIQRIRMVQALYRTHGQNKRAREELACAKRRAREAQVGVRRHSLSLTKILSNFAPDPHLRTNKRLIPSLPTIPTPAGECIPSVFARLESQKFLLPLNPSEIFEKRLSLLRSAASLR